MITTSMNTHEAVSIVEKFIKDSVAFEKRYEEKDDLEKSLSTITNKTISNLIKKEIEDITAEDLKMTATQQLLINQFVHYVFANQFRKNLITVETHFDILSYKTENGNEEFFYFVFSGQLGKPLYDLMTLNSYCEFWGAGPVVPREKLLTNTMSHKKFIDAVNEFYIAEGKPLS